MKQKTKIHNILQLSIIFALAVLYFAIAIKGLDDPITEDQGRYVQYAENLSNGFYTTRDACFLWNGPGYPITLTFFKICGFSFKWARLLNPLFMSGSIYFIFRFFREYFTTTKALWGGIISGLFFPVWPMIPQLSTECQSYFLCSMFCCFMGPAINRKNVFYIIVAGVVLGFLTLTKCFFGYVCLAVIIIALFLSIFTRTRLFKPIIVLIISQVVCLPYLLYTYSLTGEFPYWTNCGGTVLYSMANPVEHEFGDWKAVFSPGCEERVEHHRDIIDRLGSLNYYERDKLLKQEAISMIKNNPAAYIKNYICNLGRLFFNYPFAYKQQTPKTLFIMVPTSLLFFCSLSALIPFFANFRKIPAEIIIMLLLSIVYIGGGSLVYATARYMVTIAPALIVIVYYHAIRFVGFSSDRLTGTR
jgi:4-amino-4-deoxy-L-arabinose transferase-like glycosyltransferase